jgi:hypothetical protein
MEATCSSETSTDFQRTTRRYIPDNNILHNHRCENLKSYIVISKKQNKNLTLYAHQNWYSIVTEISKKKEGVRPR